MIRSVVVDAMGMAGATHPWWTAALRTRDRRCLLVALAAIAASWLTIPAPANATQARYDVTSCNQSGTNSSAAWQFDAGNRPTNFEDPDPNCSLIAQVTPNSGLIPNPGGLGVSGTSWYFDAPANTTFVNIFFDGAMNRFAGPDDWWAMLDALDFGGAGTLLTGCDINTTACSWNSTGTFAIPGSTTRLRMFAGCWTSCDTTNGFGLPFASTELRGSRVRMQDNADPVVGNQGGTALGGWIRGAGHTLAWDAFDDTGIRRAEVHVDQGGTVTVPFSTNWACNYSLRVPCTDHDPSYTVDSTAFANGALPILLRAWDAANITGAAAGQVQDSAGTWGNRRTITETLEVDNLAPVTPASVADGGGADVGWTNDPSQLLANWPAGSDAHSGVRDYRICFSTAANCAGTVANSAYVAATSRTAGSLSLAEGSTWLACVRTRDNALDSAGNPGNESAWRCSDGQRVDVTAPVPGAVSDGPAADIDEVNATTSLQFNWPAATDNLSGVSSYEYCISAASSTGADCAGAATRAWTALGASPFTASGLPALANGTTYYACMRVRDTAGTWSGPTCSDGQRIDRTAPSGATLVSPPMGSAHASWPALTATYADSAPASPGTVEIQVCPDSACATVTSSGSSARIASGADGSWTPSVANGTWWWRARAVDGAGNVSTFTATRQVFVGTTAGTLTVDSPGLSMGALLPGDSGTATTIVTVATNASNGYALQASDGSNTAGATQGVIDSIPDWTGTATVPTVWPAATRGYFGITVLDAPGGRDVRWGTGTGTAPTDFVANRFTGLTATSATIHTRGGFNAAPEEIDVAYRVAPATSARAGVYSTTISYTLVALP